MSNIILLPTYFALEEVNNVVPMKKCSCSSECKEQVFDNGFEKQEVKDNVVRVDFVKRKKL